MGVWQCRALHVGLNERERETWAVWCETTAAGAACETSKAEVTCMARLVACRDAKAAGRGSGRVVGVRALWTIVRHTEGSVGRSGLTLCPAACVCMLAASGEREIHLFGGMGEEHKACLMPHA
jgi:hypothetical protein